MPVIFQKKRQILMIEDTQITSQDRFPDFEYRFEPNQIARYRQEEPQAFYFECANKLQFKITIISASCFRFCYAPKGEFEADFSYAILPGFSSANCEVDIDEQAHFYEIKTSKLICQISKENLQLKISDAKDGQLLLQEAAPFFAKSSILKGVKEVKVTHEHLKDTSYFGLGDKTGRLNLHGQKFQNWNTDSFGYGKKTDPLYRTIPFYYGLTKGKGYGVFFHNTYKSHFDFGKTVEDQCSFAAEGGQADYFFFYGPELSAVSDQYMALTGKPELPPLWALGFHQCRWSYFPESRVQEVANEFRERKIPCDAIYLDIDYMDGYRCFTWNKSFFPDPKKLISELQAKGFQTVVMIDPGIRVDKDYEVYRSGLQKNAFCRRSSGEIMLGPVWPSECVFPDFTHPEVREWWQQLYEELYVEQGISGFWNDMNEPAVFKVNNMTFPDHVLHNFDGHPTDHRRAHNIYGQQMSKATLQGLKKLKPQKRPFVLTRASYSGGQRYAALWTGDNIASWEHLSLANIQCQRLSLSGFSFVGSDIGGFAKHPDGELFTRWLQLSVFHPLFRVHSMGNNTDGATEVDHEAVFSSVRDNRMDQEPWSFGAPYTEIAKKAIEFRYQLLPYLYTAFWEYTTNGQPILKSLAFVNQEDSNCINRENEFLFGHQILVCPVLKSKQKTLKCYLPKGEWSDYYTGKSYPGNQFYRIKVKEDQLPLFVRQGSVIPNYPVQQYIGEQNFTSVDLRIYPGQPQQSIFYEDQGEGYEYLDQKYKLRKFDFIPSKSGFILKQEQQGDFLPSYSNFNLKILGLMSIRSLEIDGKPLLNLEVSKISVPVNFKKIQVEY